MTQSMVDEVLRPVAHVAPEPPPAVRAHGVARTFGRIVAVGGISLTIARGTTFGLLGPNASGKSTLLRIVAGVLASTAGHVEVFGRRPSGEARREIGYMAQVTALVPHLSVWENMRLFAGLQGVRARDQMVEAIAAAGLAEQIHRPVQHLSGGMQRRASFACAIAHGPQLILLDEPTVGLDPTIRREFWERFRQLNAAGVTIVLSTHLMDEAERCDQLGILRDGRLLAQGSPAELQRNLRVESMEALFVRLTEAQNAD